MTNPNQCVTPIMLSRLLERISLTDFTEAIKKRLPQLSRLALLNKTMVF